MIYTRFGTPVTIIASSPHHPDGDFVTLMRRDGSKLETLVCELTADNGLIEIDAAIAALAPKAVQP